MNWKELIPGCFGEADLEFSLNPLDEKRSAEMINMAFNENTTRDVIIGECEKYLQEKGATKKHIKNQIIRIDEKIKSLQNKSDNDKI